MHVASVGRAFPPHYYTQQTLFDALKQLWAGQPHALRRLETLHRNVEVGGRHLALPIEGYRRLGSFTESNDAFIACAVELGAEAIRDGLERAGLAPRDVDHLFFVSVTGVATPSIDARLVNRLGLRPDVKRTPMFGLGCVAGAAGVARAADYLRAFPGHTAVLLSVELCSLTLQTAQGLYLTDSWYWDLNPETRAFGKRFFEKFGREPTMDQAGAYSATLTYLKAVKAVGTTDSDKVMAELKRAKINDMFTKGGYIRADGVMIHDMYVMQVKSPQESKYPWDYYKVVTVMPGTEAFGPITGRCTLAPK